MKKIVPVTIAAFVFWLLGIVLILTIVIVGTLGEKEQEALGGAVLARELRSNELNNIKTKMESLKVTYGEYTQVTLDERILIRDGEVVDQQLMDLLPANMTVTVYSGPSGDGFELIQTLSGRIVHYGFGGEAPSRTFTELIPVATASST